MSPGEPDAGGRLLANLVLFSRVLRDLGVDVTPGQTAALARALPTVDIGSRRQVRDAARTVLVHRRQHLAVFDRAFDRFWRAWSETADAAEELGRLQPPPRRERAEKRVVAVEPADPAARPELDTDEVLEERVFTWSLQETLRHRDFAELSSDEEATVRRFLQERPFELAPRRTRRRIRAAKGPHLDLRRSLRQSLRHGGEPVTLHRRRAKEKPRPLVMICDVSASMEVYSRILLQFVYAVAQGSERLEAFAFGTRLTRITRQLQNRHVHRALDDAVTAVVDWGGGTRIGDSLKAFNQHWGRRVLGQGAVVVLISDGWDCGDPALLAREMGRLQRTCRRLLWLNPLLASPGYEPLTRGMQAALPLVDDFLPVHNLHSLEQLAELLRDPDRHDPRSDTGVNRHARRTG